MTPEQELYYVTGYTNNVGMIVFTVITFGIIFPVSLFVMLKRDAKSGLLVCCYIFVVIVQLAFSIGTCVVYFTTNSLRYYDIVNFIPVAQYGGNIYTTCDVSNCACVNSTPSEMKTCQYNSDNNISNFCVDPKYCCSYTLIYSCNSIYSCDSIDCRNSDVCGYRKHCDKYGYAICNTNGCKNLYNDVVVTLKYIYNDTNYYKNLSSNCNDDKKCLDDAIIEYNSIKIGSVKKESPGNAYLNINNYNVEIYYKNYVTFIALLTLACVSMFINACIIVYNSCVLSGRRCNCRKINLPFV
jgi:hypothetical protein